MMELYTFQKDYYENLRKNVKEGRVDAYGKDKFDYDPNAIISTNLAYDDELLEKMLDCATPDKDYEAAVILYEALPKLSRIQANYRPFWAHLAHVELYPYMVARFCNGEKPDVKNVKNHWWHSNAMRHGLSNLWWSVKQTIDESHPEDKYHYTKYFFTHIDFRQRRMGSSTLFRHKEAVIGILKYLEENVTYYFEGRANFIMMYFNKQATLRQLPICTRDDFYNELKGIKDDINKIQLREDAAGVLQDQSEDWDF